jgi:hypothetical protein
MNQAGNFYSYIFFDAEPSIKTLTKDSLEAAKKEFIACIESNAHINSRSYATLALRPDTRFMLHMNGESPDPRCAPAYLVHASRHAPHFTVRRQALAEGK